MLAQLHFDLGFDQRFVHLVGALALCPDRSQMIRHRQEETPQVLGGQLSRHSTTFVPPLLPKQQTLLI